MFGAPANRRLQFWARIKNGRDLHTEVDIPTELVKWAPYVLRQLCCNAAGVKPTKNAIFRTKRCHQFKQPRQTDYEYFTPCIAILLGSALLSFTVNSPS